MQFSLQKGSYYKSEGLGLEYGNTIIFHESDQLYKDFNLDKGNRKLKQLIGKTKFTRNSV